jgi:hypothetical protein
MFVDQCDALTEAADGDGISFDGLSVRATGDDEYAFETPSERRQAISASDLCELARDHQSFVTNWHYWTALAPDDEASFAFLRWLERAPSEGVNEEDALPVPERYAALADGHSRTWGQLRITVSLGSQDGHRRYAVRHVDDGDAPDHELTSYSDPLDARELAKHDERGRYRPLKTAPSLQSGWVFTDLDGDDLLRAVDFLYPATIANWHREQRGNLDVTHWQATAERQTGIYDVVDDLQGEQVKWLAEATCVDSQCLKRREWDETADAELDVPRGDNEFPCREPCSLVIAAARKWTKLEDEDEQTYEFTLTPSEKEQVEAIIDAVADDEVDEIREADVYDGANRYRARFLRAKRFDERGRFCGVESGHESSGDDHH